MTSRHAWLDANGRPVLVRSVEPPRQRVTREDVERVYEQCAAEVARRRRRHGALLIGIAAVKAALVAAYVLPAVLR